MFIEIKVPDIGVDELEVTEIRVKVGDKVEYEDPLIMVEGDKALMEIPSPQPGLVKEIRVKTGDKVRTGTLIMIFESDELKTKSDTENEKITNLEHTLSNVVLNKKIKEVKEENQEIKEIYVPNIGSDTAEVIKILVKLNDKVEKKQSLITVENEKFLMEIRAPFSGIVKAIEINLGEIVSTGSLVMILEMKRSVMSIIPSHSKSASELTSQFKNEKKASHSYEFLKFNDKGKFVQDEIVIHATPVVRRLAREIGIELTAVKGTGRKGRILKEDIFAYAKDRMDKVKFSPIVSENLSNIPTIYPEIDFSKYGDTEEVELSRIQKVSGTNLSRNWMTIPHVTHFDKSDITELEEFRKQQNSEAEKYNLNTKITLVVFIMKAVSFALEKMPRFNSSLSKDGQKLILKKYINIGVAVDTPRGLVVPVFKNVNKKGIIELSRELITLSKKARDGKIVSSEMQGGCFTISSIGSLGTTYYTPIINAPEAAILGISKCVMDPVWNGKKFVPRLILPISLSFDHRIIDGADGARFITIIKNNLSDIRRLIM